MNPDLNRLMGRLGYTFSDEALLSLALTHRSVSRNRNNERLEFLGDAQLGQIISVALFERFPEAAEGQLTRMRASLVRGKTLAEVARELDLGDYLRLGGGELKSGGFRRDSILADALEAIIGAMLVDGGQARCREVVLSLFAERLSNITPQNAEKDPKTRLQEWLQARRFELPVYQMLHVEGLAPKQVFDVACELDLVEQTFRAKGASRRKAEQEAAAQALLWLEQHYE